MEAPPKSYRKNLTIISTPYSTTILQCDFFHKTLLILEKPPNFKLFSSFFLYLQSATLFLWCRYGDPQRCSSQSLQTSSNPNFEPPSNAVPGSIHPTYIRKARPKHEMVAISNEQQRRGERLFLHKKRLQIRCLHYILVKRTHKNSVSSVLEIRVRVRVSCMQRS